MAEPADLRIVVAPAGVMLADRADLDQAERCRRAREGVAVILAADEGIDLALQRDRGGGLQDRREGQREQAGQARQRAAQRGNGDDGRQSAHAWILWVDVGTADGKRHGGCPPWRASHSPAGTGPDPRCREFRSIQVKHGDFGGCILRRNMVPLVFRLGGLPGPSFRPLVPGSCLSPVATAPPGTGSHHGTIDHRLPPPPSRARNVFTPPTSSARFPARLGHIAEQHASLPNPC